MWLLVFSIAVSLFLLEVVVNPFARSATPVNGVYYFNGTSQDNANKAQCTIGSPVPCTPTATFSKTAPTGTSSIQQTGDANCNQKFAGSPFCIWWLGDYSGPIDGDLALCTYWSSPASGAVATATMSVYVYADPDLAAGTGTLLGNGTIQIKPGAANSPVASAGSVPVSGAVNKKMLIQITPNDQNSNGPIVNYGSTSAPSSFGPPGLACGKAASPSAGASGSPSASPSGSPSPSKKKSPHATIRFSDTTPKKGHPITATAGIKACAGNQGTKIQLQKKKGKVFKKVAQKKLDKKCKATFKINTSFHSATFRSFWPSQDPAYKSGASKPQTVTTH